MGSAFIIMAGTVLGITLRYLGPPWPQWLLIAMMVLFVIFWAVLDGARKIVATCPRTATFGFQAAALNVGIAVALLNAATTWFAVSLPGWLGEGGDAGSPVPSGQIATISALIIGATNGFLAKVLLDDAKDSGGKYWPDALQRAALAAAFSEERLAPRKVKVASDSELYHAVFSPSTKDNAVKGWDFRARLKRATIIKDLKDDAEQYQPIGTKAVEPGPHESKPDKAGAHRSIPKAPTPGVSNPVVADRQDHAPQEGNAPDPGKPSGQ